MVTFDNRNFGMVTKEYLREQERLKRRAELEIKVIQRHGHIIKISRISDEGLAMMLEPDYPIIKREEQ